MDELNSQQKRWWQTKAAAAAPPPPTSFFAKDHSPRCQFEKQSEQQRANNKILTKPWFKSPPITDKVLYEFNYGGTHAQGDNSMNVVLVQSDKSFVGSKQSVSFGSCVQFNDVLLRLNGRILICTNQHQCQVRPTSGKYVESSHDAEDAATTCEHPPVVVIVSMLYRRRRRLHFDCMTGNVGGRCPAPRALQTQNPPNPLSIFAKPLTGGP